MDSRNGGVDEQARVTVGCRDDQAFGVTFCDRSDSDGYAVHYAVELRAPGLSARLDGVVAWLGSPGLASFLDGLAADPRPWEGERSWRTDDRDLTVSAVFRSGGYLGLTWNLRPWRRAAGDWSASATTWLEAGEQMSAFAADIRHFLARERA